MSKFAAFQRQWWRLQLSEKFSNGTKIPKQTNNGLKYIILCKLCETSLARVRKFKWQKSYLDMRLIVNVQMLHKCDNYHSIMWTCIWLLSIFDYDFLSDCPSMMHFIGIRYMLHFKQCWSFGYMSLLTLSFMYRGIISCMCIDWERGYSVPLENFHALSDVDFTDKWL